MLLEFYIVPSHFYNIVDIVKLTAVVVLGTFEACKLVKLTNENTRNSEASPLQQNNLVT